MELNPKWERLFSSAVLARGYDYHLEDRVCNLRADDSGWTATVRGSDDYSVFIPNADHGKLEARCDCPHFADGHSCKHLAATCFEIEHLIQEGTGFDDQREVENVRSGSWPTVEKLVETIDETTARKFLLIALNEDESLRRRFVGTFTEPDLKRLRYELGRSIEQAVRSFGHRGFIDYRSAYPFYSELSDIVHACIGPLVKRRALWEAFELTAVVLLKLQTIQIDDSDGFFTDMMRLCEDYWSSIVSQADQELKRRLFDWLVEFARENPGRDEVEIYWFERERVEDFLIDTFASEPAFAQTIQNVADRNIEDCQANLQAGHSEQPYLANRYRFDLSRWTLVRLRTMQTLGATDNDLLTFAEPMMGCRDVRAFFVDDALARDDAHRAIALLEKGKALADGRYPIDESKQLLALYDHTRDEKKAKQELFDLAVHDTRIYGNEGLSWFRQLRKRCNADKWPDTRERVLAAVQSDSVKRSYLADEGLAERLKASIDTLEGYGRFPEVERFADVLENDYPAWLLREYRSAVEEELRRTSGRSVYQDAAGKMLRMQRIVGGETVVGEMVESFKTRYPRRRALMEELGKL